MGMADFYTRSKSNEGIVVPLKLPGGEPSNEWIRIRGRYSDSFREANAKAMRRLFDAASEKDEAKRREKAADLSSPDSIASITEEVRISLVVAWSFPEPCTPENILNLFREAPQLADQIDQVAADKALFFAPELKSSPDSPSSSSD